MTTNTQKIEKLNLVGGRTCLDFANTVSWRGAQDPKDLLQTYEDLVTWGARAGLLDPAEAGSLLALAASNPIAANEALSRAIALRETIAGIFDAVAAGEEPKEADMAALTGFLREGLAHVQLSRSPTGYDLSFEAADSLDRLLPPMAWSAVELLRDSALSRVKSCSGDTCGWLFVDSSKNHSRRWCEMKDCGNRAKARRHYHKTRGLPPDPG